MTFAALLVIQKRDRTSGDRSRPTSLGKELLLFGTLGHAKVHLRPLVVKKRNPTKKQKKRADGSLFCFSTIYLFLEFPATMRKRRSSCMSETASAAT